MNLNQIQVYMNILGIKEIPFTENELKKNYRRVIKIAHPDLGGSNEESAKVNEAYNELLPYCGQHLSYQQKQRIPRYNTITVQQRIFCPSCIGLGYTLERKTCIIEKSILKTILNYLFYIITGRSITKLETVMCKHCGGSGIVTIHRKYHRII